MTTRTLSRFVPLAVCLLLAARSAAAAEADGELAAYTTKIRPLLAERCFSCHGGIKQEAGLRLDTVGLMTAGGDSGAVIVKGDPDKSLILERVKDPDPATRMPPEAEGEPFSAEQVALLRGWIKAGCPAPPDEKPEADPREHWAFQPRVRPAVPEVKNIPGIRNPIDAFLASARAEAGVTAQPEAARHVLVRRLYVDLIGLPPQPEELAAIEADPSADWYERLVDKLLADPRHGERWARHWMDVWRYADWWGLADQHRNSAKHIWHFRDWIVESLNADSGYDEMVRMMLAADELHPEDQDKLRATGYLARNWFLFGRNVWLEETVEHVGKGLLGLTMNCSKCHDHKYDPITQADFYRMRAFFEPYHVRLDVVPGESDLEKDGLPRVFDGQPDTPTYLFIRGNEATPDKTKPMEPGVPEVIAFREIDVRTVSLPKPAFEPQRQPWVLDNHVAEARRAVETAEAAVAKAVEKETAAKMARAAAEQKTHPKPAAAPPSSPAAPGSFADDFTALDAGRWKVFGGDWKHEPGRLVQGKDGQTRSALRLLPAPPRDFDATVTFTITGGSTYRSVGLSFDCSQSDPVMPLGADDSEVMVYASGWASGPKLQAAYVTKGELRYPADGAVAREVELNRVHTLRVAVRDALVNAWFDGEPVVAWRSPVPRREGSLQLHTFDATVVFGRVSLEALSGDVRLREPASAGASAQPAVDDAHAAVARAERAVAAAQASLAVEKSALESVVRRAEAMRAAWAAEDSPSAGEADPLRARARELARGAAKAEREIAVAKGRAAVGVVADKLAEATAAKRDAATIQGIEKELATARESLDKAVKAVAEAGDAFTPFVGAKWSQTRFAHPDRDDPPVAFKPTSTGRRTALAQWLTDARNPLTARVAANHIWMRHMGRPLVTTVFDFGRKGNAPTHPELLDWLASELVDGPQDGGPAGGRGWSMKHLHRLIVTSAAYRMTSSSAGAETAIKADPDNRLLWRRDAIRLEAEAVRDAMLAVSGALDATMGGPPVPASDRDASRRRSLYLFHSGVDRSTFLATFDAADAVACYQRDQSIVPQQALALSNAPFSQAAAATIAARVTKEIPAGADDDAFVGRAFFTVLGRRPDDVERTECRRAIDRLRTLPDGRAGPGAVDPARVQIVAALLNHNDFVTLR